MHVAYPAKPPLCLVNLRLLQPVVAGLVKQLKQMKLTVHRLAQRVCEQQTVESSSSHGEVAVVERVKQLELVHPVGQATRTTL